MTVMSNGPFVLCYLTVLYAALAGCSSSSEVSSQRADQGSISVAPFDLGATDLAMSPFPATVYAQPSNADDATVVLITAFPATAGAAPPSLAIGGQPATLVSAPEASVWLYRYTVNRSIDSAGDQPLLFQASDSEQTFSVSGVLQFSFGDGSNALTAGGPPGSRLTQLGDNQRTGAFLDETLLTTDTVRSGQFGQLFARSVDGQIYAQPLYLPSVAVASGKTANVVFVATEHDSVYAFDADDPTATAPLWQTSLGLAVPDASVAGGCTGIFPEMGITGTPVIDPHSGILYVVAFAVEGSEVVYRLHALDPRNGAEQLGGPIRISGSVLTSAGESLPFDPAQQLNRAALLLANGVLYVAFGGFCDVDPYHGWVFAYDPTTLANLAVYNDTVDGKMGGIWQGGRGLAADDSGDVYLMTGNGTFDTGSAIPSLGDSLVRLTYSAGNLSVKDWFTPYNEASLEELDLDLGSSGPILIPGTSLVMGRGKEGKAYLLDRDHLGYYNPADDSQIVQSFATTPAPSIAGTALWQGPTGPLLYFWSGGDVLKSFSLVDGVFETTPSSQGTIGLSGFFGADLSISANGSTPGSGIVWASETQSGVSTLHAFDALDLTNELWRSDELNYSGVTKFCPPLVAAGKVYQATTSHQLVVFGLLDPLARQPAQRALRTRSR